MRYDWDEAFITNIDATRSEARLNLVSAGITDPDPTFRVHRLAWPLYSIELVQGGEGHVTVGGVSFDVREGDLFMLQKGLDHLYWSNPDNPWSKTWFTADGALIDALIHAHNLHGVYHVANCGHLLPLFLDIYATAQAASEGSPVDTTHIADVLHRLLMEVDKVVLSGGKVRSPVAYEMKRILDGNVEGRVSLEELASQVICSPSHAIRLFKREFGETPHRYHLDRKLELARVLLSTTDMQIRAIADRLSFSDEFYFSTVFRKATRKSPQAFRRTSRM